jgi:threonine dehydratase
VNIGVDLREWRQRAVDAHDRIRELVRETPVEPALGLAPDTSARVFLKLEHLQETGSFKYRGASNKVSLLSPREREAGIVTASNGNHGLGVAAAARRQGISCEVFVSPQVSSAKAERIAAYGARICQTGSGSLDAELAGRSAAEASGRLFISPYNDADVVAGQATVGIELERQLPDLDAVFVAVGGGGLIGGIGAYLKAVSPRVQIVGCWPAHSPVMYECMQAGRIIDVAEQPTVSESTAGGLEPGSITLDLCRTVIDRAVLVSEAAILSAMHRVLESEHWVIEGSAGVAVAAFCKHAREYAGKSVAIVLCGRNVSWEILKLTVNS